MNLTYILRDKPLTSSFGTNGEPYTSGQLVNVTYFGANREPHASGQTVNLTYFGINREPYILRDKS